jgi:hypothetical protein
MSQVNVGPLREAFERSGMSTRELALRMGWLKPDNGRVNRSLGITQYDPGHGTGPRLDDLKSHVERVQSHALLLIHVCDVTWEQSCDESIRRRVQD